MRVKRFFYTQAPHARVMHIQFGPHHSEGVVACGRHSQPGWYWRSSSMTGRRPRTCSRCLRSAQVQNVILVERVRRRK